MNTKINKLKYSLNTKEKTLPKAIRTALNSYKDSVNNTLNNNFDETLKDYRKNYSNSINSILDIENEGFKTEYTLAKYFNLPTEKINKLKEDYKEPLTLAGVMDGAEEFFSNKLVA